MSALLAADSLLFGALTLEVWSAQGCPEPTVQQRLIQRLLEEAMLRGHLELAERCRTASTDDPQALPLLTDALRKVLHPCVSRRGAVLVHASDATFLQVHLQLKGLENRVYKLEAMASLEPVLERGALAALVIDLQEPEAHSLLNRVSQDPRAEGLPLLALCTGGQAGLLEALALGATDAMLGPVEQGLGGRLATLLGHDDPVVRSALGQRLPGHTAFLEAISAIEKGNAPYGLMLGQPVGFTNALREHGPTFTDELLEHTADGVRQTLGTTTRVYRLDATTIAWLTRAPREALTQRLRELANQPRTLTTPDGSPWYNRIAFGGVEVDNVPVERALHGARRMLSLAIQAGANEPVITPLHDAGPKRARALLLEPDPETAEILVRELGMQGLDVLRPHDPTDAMARLRGSPFAMVIAAVDGPSASRVMQGLRRMAPSTPVFALAPDAGSARTALQHGADDVFDKPLDASLFRARLQARFRGALRPGRVPTGPV